MKSKHTSRALRGMAVATAMFCLIPAAAHAQAADTVTKTTVTTTTTETSKMPPAPAADKSAQVIEIREGKGDVMPPLGTKTTTTKTMVKTPVKADKEPQATAGNNADSAREYTVAPGEETHPPVRLTADRTEMIHLDDDASSIIIGNPAHVNILLNNSRTLLLAPRQPGATQFTVLNPKGKIVMQRHVIVSGPKENYIRIRRTCTGAGGGCQPTTVYYCPDICHDVRLLAGQANNNGQPGDSIPAAPLDGAGIDAAGEEDAPFVTSDEAGQEEDDNAASSGSNNE